MAILRFNTNTLHLDILIGINEKFEPKEEILELNGKCVELKNKVNDFLNNTFSTSDQQEILKLMNENKELEDAWKKFLNTSYKSDIQLIIDEVKKIMQLF